MIGLRQALSMQVLERLQTRSMCLRERSWHTTTFATPCGEPIAPRRQHRYAHGHSARMTTTSTRRASLSTHRRTHLSPHLALALAPFPNPHPTLSLTTRTRPATRRGPSSPTRFGRSRSPRSSTPGARSPARRWPRRPPMAAASSPRPGRRRRRRRTSSPPPPQTWPSPHAAPSSSPSILTRRAVMHHACTMHAPCMHHACTMPLRVCSLTHSPTHPSTHPLTPLGTCSLSGARRGRGAYWGELPTGATQGRGRAGAPLHVPRAAIT